MTELSPLDTMLLSQDLPELSQVTVESPVGGWWSIAQPVTAVIRQY